MANVYAVKSGNWSDITVWNTGALPTSADDVYSNNFTVTIDQDINVLSLRSRAGSPAVAGGGFVISSAVTVTVTGVSTGIIGGLGSCITFSGVSGVTATINASRIEGPDANNSQTINHAGAGTLTISCTVYAASGSSTNRYTILFNSTGVLNYSGATILGNFATASFVVTGTGTINMVANITGGSNVSAIDLNAAATVNITGDIYGGSNSGRGLSITASAIVSITGNVRSSVGGPGIFISGGNPQINVTGNVLPEVASPQVAINGQTVVIFLKIIGTISANTGQVAVASSSTSAINIFSGPFISSVNGIMPFSCTRMHYHVTINSYFEFRDSSTNGALPPATPAPATRLVSPDTVVDAPIPSDVRDGVSYALNTFTGTLKVPPTASVAFGVPVDNTTGVALLTGDSWIAAISSSNDPFAERLKNVATVQTTAAQIAAF
jgi:hypothetical protein